MKLLIEAVIPVFEQRDLVSAMDFYRKIGFEIDSDDKGKEAIVSIENIQLMLVQSKDETESGARFYVEARGVAGLYSLFRKGSSGWSDNLTYSENSSGYRELSVTDTSSNTIIFTEETYAG
jgi:hypothetical protein